MVYDTVVHACRKAGFEAGRWLQLAPHFSSIVNLVGGGARRIDRAGVDDASARDGHRVSA